MVPGARLGRGADIPVIPGSTSVGGTAGTEGGADTLEEGAGGDTAVSEG